MILFVVSWVSVEIRATDQEEGRGENDNTAGEGKRYLGVSQYSISLKPFRCQGTMFLRPVVVELFFGTPSLRSCRMVNLMARCFAAILRP